jgi:3',5'-cyclic AMP phosphodiesterase CpdA
MTRRAAIARLSAAALLFASLSCDRAASPVARDFAEHPVIVDLPQPATLYAVSDVHGGYRRLVALLAAHHLIDAAPPTPAEARWAAGGAALVVAGDLVDKGPEGLEVVELLRALAGDAPKSGGVVVVLLGNHEAELLADPKNAKAEGADGLDAELRHDGLDPTAFVRSDPRAAWLATLPFGLQVGGWFFAHAGDTSGKRASDLARAIEAGLASEGWSADAIIGDGSLLESRVFGDDASVGARDAAALGVKHIVFGHDPHALGAAGEIAVSADGVLFRIDCGMSPDVDYSEGALLRISREASGETAEALLPGGSATVLWKGD